VRAFSGTRSATLFQNRREPRWAVILTNLQDDPTLADELEQSFKVDLKQPPLDEAD
jgi:hypothetical protein